MCGSSSGEAPAVVMVGPRQAGKTTLALSIAGERPSVYLDLELASDRAKLEDPEHFLSALGDKLVILDEVHRVPGVFQPLRGLIDRGRRKGRRVGRFLLLGSASVELLRQSGESLAGRLAHIEMTPLHVMEVGESRQETLWIRGGFPDSLLAESDVRSMRWRRDFIRTYLERDIAQLAPRIPAETLRRCWTMLAHHQGGLLNAAQLARALSVDGKTVAGYLDLLRPASTEPRREPRSIWCWSFPAAVCGPSRSSEASLRSSTRFFSSLVKIWSPFVVWSCTRVERATQWAKALRPSALPKRPASSLRPDANDAAGWRRGGVRETTWCRWRSTPSAAIAPACAREPAAGAATRSRRSPISALHFPITAHLLGVGRTVALPVWEWATSDGERSDPVFYAEVDVASRPPFLHAERDHVRVPTALDPTTFAKALAGPLRALSKTLAPKSPKGLRRPTLHVAFGWVVPPEGIDVLLAEVNRRLGHESKLTLERLRALRSDEDVWTIIARDLPAVQQEYFDRAVPGVFPSHPLAAYALVWMHVHGANELRWASSAPPTGAAHRHLPAPRGDIANPARPFH